MELGGRGIGPRSADSAQEANRFHLFLFLFSILFANSKQFKYNLNSQFQLECIVNKFHHGLRLFFLFILFIHLFRQMQHTYISSQAYILKVRLVLEVYINNLIILGEGKV